MVDKKGSDINQDFFPVSVFLSLSLQLYDSNKNMWIDSNQVCELSLIRRRNWKIITGSQIMLLTHSMALIFKEILLFVLPCKFIVFGCAYFVVFRYYQP